jgi:hypothetical protein
MANTIITFENDPGRYQTLHATWLKEKQPSVVMSGSATYRMVQNAQTKEIEFHLIDTKSWYESRSF